MIVELHPLFKNEDIEKANEFLSNKFNTNGNIKFVSLQENISNMNIPTHFISRIINDIYGINQPQMANFFIVQEYVDRNLRDRLYRYLKLLNINFDIIDFIPGSIASQYVFYKMSSGEMAPLEHWDPSILWDFNKLQNPEKELLSPLNGFVHMELTLKNIKYNHEFIMSLIRNNIINDKFDTDKDIIPELRLKLLPYNNFNKVMNIANSIFRFL